MIKKIFIISILLFSTILFGCNKQEDLTIKKYYKTTIVSTGAISIGNSYIGYTDSFNKLKLGTKTGGKIMSILKSEGDTIKKGELLVILDNSEAKVGYNGSSNIVNSLNLMKSSTSDMFDEQIKAMQSKIETVKVGDIGISAGIEDTKNITEETLNTANAQIDKANLGIETAKINLEETKNILYIKEKHIYENTKNSITQSLILDTSIIDYIDILFGITPENKDENDDIEDYLGTKDSKLLKETKEYFKNVNQLFIEYRELYENHIEDKNPSYQTIKEVSEKGIILAEKIKVLLKNTYNTIDNSIDNVKLTKETINNYKTQISNFGEKIEASLLSISGEYILGLKGSIENMDNFTGESKLKISLLEKQLSLAEENLKIAKTTYNNYDAISKGKITDIKTKKNISEKTLEELKANLKSLRKQKTTKLKEIDINIKKIYLEQNTSSVMINNGKIISPIDGIIINKKMKKGEITSPGFPIITIATNNKIKVLISVNNDLVSKLKIGNKTNIELVEENKIVLGTITKIFPTKNIITKKTLIELSIDNKNRNIKIGSMVKVYFGEKTKTGIIIPNKAIISKFMIPGVMIKKGNIAKFIEIKILKQNDDFSLIEGIKPMEEIITQGQENIYDNEELK